MCGRFVSSTPASVLARHFDAEEPPSPHLGPSWNVAPTDEVYAVAFTRGARRVGRLSWGLLPGWSRGPAPRRRMINIRAETATSKPGFRSALRQRRCIVPADGFYEWKDMGAGRAKQPFLIRGRGGAPLAFAGLWDVWRPAEGDGPPVRSCAILTTEPNEMVAGVHDRMPVVLQPDSWDLWLDAESDDADALAGLLGPAPARSMEMWPVGTGVNRVQNDGPALARPVVQGMAEQMSPGEVIGVLVHDGDTVALEGGG